MTWTAVVGFLAAVLPLVLTPGASLALATQRTLAGQPRAAVWVVAGTATGICTHALLAAAGLSAVVVRSAEAFTAVRVAGGVYLVGLGLLTLRQARRRPAAGAVPQAPGRVRHLPWAGHHAYPQAVLANVLNPKAASVYLTLAPQFIAADHVGAGFAVLATVHVVAMGTWLTAWSALLARGRGARTSRRVSALAHRVGGGVLIALGIRTTVTA